MKLCSKCNTLEVFSKEMCKPCYFKEWRKNNPQYHIEWRKTHSTYHRDWARKHPKYNDKYRFASGVIPYDKNESCSLYLGVHVAERILSKVFKDVEMMPMHHPGYDFICNQGKKIDVKSSCARTSYGHIGHWNFGIDYNDIADFFLCIAIDNRENLIPQHLWLIPGNVVNSHSVVSIAPSTIGKWDEYKLDIGRVSECFEFALK